MMKKIILVLSFSIVTPSFADEVQESKHVFEPSLVQSAFIVVVGMVLVLWVLPSASASASASTHI